MVTAPEALGLSSEACLPTSDHAPAGSQASWQNGPAGLKPPWAVLGLRPVVGGAHGGSGKPSGVVRLTGRVCPSEHRKACPWENQDVLELAGSWDFGKGLRPSQVISILPSTEVKGVP